jgi:hypothetical protein
VCLDCPLFVDIDFVCPLPVPFSFWDRLREKNHAPFKLNGQTVEVLRVGVMIVGVISVGVMIVEVISVGVMTVGVMTLSNDDQPLYQVISGQAIETCSS